MANSVKVSGAWKAVSRISVKVGGAWKTATPYVKVGGVWKVAVASITATDWGVGSGASPLSSASRALTVPAGNPGVIRLEIDYNDATLDRNLGSWVTVTDAETLSVTDGQSLTFRLTGSSFDGASVSVYDHTTGDLIGTWIAAIT